MHQDYGQSQGTIQPELVSERFEYFYSPLDSMLVHRRATSCIIFLGTHLCTRVENCESDVSYQTTQRNGSNPGRSFRSPDH